MLFSVIFSAGGTMRAIVLKAAAYTQTAQRGDCYDTINCEMIDSTCVVCLLLIVSAQEVRCSAQWRCTTDCAHSASALSIDT
eukprot:20796-Heterococcus_DN1.PRE.6